MSPLSTPSGLHADPGAQPDRVRRETSDTYDRIARAYADRAALTSEMVAHLERFVAVLPAGGRVLDAGSGPGHASALLAEKGIYSIALDSSVEMLRLAAQHVPVVRGDLRRLPFAGAVLDGIWSNASLLHVARPEVPATLADWRRALRPGGVLGLSTAVGEDDEQGWEALPYAPDAQAYDAPLRRWFVYHSAARLQSLITDAGFEIQHVGMRESHRRWLQVIAVAGSARGCCGE